MKLNYRGVSYEYNPPVVETNEGESNGKYRGLDWRFRNPKKVPVLHTNLDLKYRGLAYQTGETTQSPVEAVPVANPETASIPVLSTEDRARSLMLSHSRIIKTRQQAMLSRTASEVGLTGNIAQYWGRIQGKIHPTFRATYDRRLATN